MIAKSFDELDSAYRDRRIRQPDPVSYRQQKERIMSAVTPGEYVDLCFLSSLRKQDLMRITHEWLQLKGYTIKDINSARNRHYYWKMRKSLNSLERSKIRNARFAGQNTHWSEEMLLKFIDMNLKKDNGRYQVKDVELAEIFRCSIYAVQGLRRKLNIIERMQLNAGKKFYKKTTAKFMKKTEKELRNLSY